MGGLVFIRERKKRSREEKQGDESSGDKRGEMFVPFLGSQSVLDLFPSVVVDEGAIKFLLNGADVMRPGIRKMDDWGPSGTFVVVKEEKKGRAIAIGLSATSSSEASAMSKGSCLKNLHYLGDRYWTLYKQL